MKKFFSLSAIVAVLAMLMTSVSVSSCSSDEDDDSTTTTPTYTSFSGIVDGDDELNIARYFSIYYFAGSFLSIKDGKIYNSTASADELKDVEIVFNGTNFVTAASSANSTVSTNGNSATLTTNANGTIAYVTSTGYMGTIICTGTTGYTCIGTTPTSYTVSIIVKHISCQQVYYSLRIN